MNYFSHFLFDHQPANHEFNTGIILPDFTRHYIKRFQISDDGSHFSQTEKYYLYGCIRHYETDKKFHSSSFFHDHYHLILDKIKNSQLSAKVERKWFMSHILFELLIDRIFVRSHKVELDQFYSSLQLANNMNLHSFLLFYGISTDHRFFQIFNHFCEVKYIYYYTDNNKFVYSLNRIMMRVGLQPLDENDSMRITEVVEKLEEMVFQNDVLIMNEIKRVLI